MGFKFLKGFKLSGKDWEKIGKKKFCVWGWKAESKEARKKVKQILGNLSLGGDQTARWLGGVNMGVSLFFFRWKGGERESSGGAMGGFLKNFVLGVVGTGQQKIVIIGEGAVSTQKNKSFQTENLGGLKNPPFLGGGGEEQW